MFTQSSEPDIGHSILKKIHKNAAKEDISAEYNLPDYLPDINRLLKISARITDATNSPSDDMIGYDGKIRFSILYATSDGILKNAEFDSEYSGNAPLSDVTQECDIYPNPHVENVSCRLQNPRKLHAKAKLAIDVDILFRVPTTPSVIGKIDAADADHMQYRTSMIRSVLETHLSSEPSPISEDIELPPSMPPIEQIISVELEPCVSDIRLTGEHLLYKGDIFADILYQAKEKDPTSENAPPCFLSFTEKIPISGEIDADGILDPCSAVASVKIDSLEFRMQETPSEESRVVELDLDYTVSAKIFCNEENEIITDMYSTDYETENEEETLSYETVLCAKSFNFSADGNTPRDDKDFDKILSTNAAVTTQSIEKQGNKLIFTGTAEISVILTNGNGVYLNRSYSVPLRAQTDAGKVSDLFRGTFDAFVLRAASRLDEKAIDTDLEILISYVIFEQHQDHRIRQSSITKERATSERSKSTITLCYPGLADSLWDIAKKYGTTVPELMAANALSAQEIPPVLIIPAHGKKTAGYAKLIE